ncbi:MAG: sugar phosphate isomerase/epimerase [Planctomycetaceae bacterium]|nr:sugar phosphate isomerase/epimerase [Planctomycetaceae bacterium]
MVRMSMNEMTTFSWTFDEDVQRYVEAGYEGIGVWRPKLADFGEARGIELLLESGLHVSNLLWAGGFTGSDGRGYEDSIVDGIEAIELAAALHADCLVVYSGARDGHIYNHARRITRNALKQLLTVAESLGVTLAIEPVHPACGGDWTFLHSLDDVFDLISSIHSPYLKLAFDTYHLGQTPLCFDRLRQIAPAVGIVHLADARQPPNGEQNRCLIGEGGVPIREIVSALQDGGFDGFFDVELMGEDIESCEYGQILEHSRLALSELISA